MSPNDNNSSTWDNKGDGTKARSSSNSPLSKSKPNKPIDTPQIISFTTSEATHLLNPHHDVLVISLNIANCLVKRILIDNGNSANIFFLETIKAKGIPEENITRRTTMLIGFSGEQKNNLGEIVLLVYAKGVNLHTQFLLMDSPSAYNVILGRP
ncbi:uncharacterized protein LOC111384473 [Olea europaea var. sylvestris]|uniref:uncharacterized protein LOC111384473 n=1 Tax=Olea europaea var. sylvestris TaxID=158386 RepID=UPI000C1D4C78|nr:uncharacterized protein LOC111384473 [Olea europaea var. sylvestris]